MIYKRTSHLRETAVVDGYTQLYNPPFVPDFKKSSEYVITQKYVRRPDLLAYDLYGDAHFWWVFPLFNPNELVNPINDMTLNKKIIVPSRDYVAGI